MTYRGDANEAVFATARFQLHVVWNITAGLRRGGNKHGAPPTVQSVHHKNLINKPLGPLHQLAELKRQSASSRSHTGKVR